MRVSGVLYLRQPAAMLRDRVNHVGKECFEVMRLSEQLFPQEPSDQFVAYISPRCERLRTPQSGIVMPRR